MKTFAKQILFVFFAVSLAACGGKTSENKAETETTVEADPAVKASYDEYVALIGKAVSLVEKVKKGEGAAHQEWVISVPKIKSLALELQRNSDKLTKAQNDSIVELAKKYAEATLAVDAK